MIRSERRRAALFQSRRPLRCWRALLGRVGDRRRAALDPIADAARDDETRNKVASANYATALIA